MSLDKFGRSSHSSDKSKPKRFRLDFPRTSQGDFDFTHHKLCNVDPPNSDSDAATKGFIDMELTKIETVMTEKIGKEWKKLETLIMEQEKANEEKFEEVNANVNRADNDMMKLKQKVRLSYSANNQYVQKVDESVKELRGLVHHLRDRMDMLGTRLTTLELNVPTGFKKSDDKINDLYRRYSQVQRTSSYQGSAASTNVD